MEYKTIKLINKQKSFTAYDYTDSEEELVNISLSLY